MTKDILKFPRRARWFLNSFCFTWWPSSIRSPDWPIGGNPCPPVCEWLGRVGGSEVGLELRGVSQT